MGTWKARINIVNSISKFDVMIHRIQWKYDIRYDNCGGEDRIACGLITYMFDYYFKYHLRKATVVGRPDESFAV